jgi:hypothetical protein
MVVTLLVMLAGIAAGCAPLPRRDASPVPEDSAARISPILAAVFAPWYGYDPATGACRGGTGSYHWNNDPNMAGVLDTPERGFYCSADPNVIRWQLDGLHRAGVRTLLVSWWGWGDGNLDGVTEGQPDAALNQGIRALLDTVVAVSDTQPISVSLIVEPFVKTQAHIAPSALSNGQR